MKKILFTVLITFITIIFLGGAAVGVWAYRKYTPSKAMADTAAWFQVSGDEIAVVLNNELVEDTKGKYISGQVYLPLTWVNEHLNERFYWSSEDSQLIYALPESVVYADASTLGSSGAPLFVQTDEAVWLLAEVIPAYTNVRIERFVEGDVKRVYIDTVWEAEQTADVKKESKIRVRGGIKSDILTEAEQHQRVEILEMMDKWAKVRTEDGYIGYIQEKRLDDIRSEARISTFQEPVYTSIELGEPVSMIWHQVMVPEANKNMEKLIENTRGVNVIAPTWFMLTDNEGNFDSLADHTYVNKAHNLGMQVWAVADNFNRGEKVRGEVLFASTKARRKLISGLVEEVLRYNIDGINLDIESLKPEAGVHYIQFIRELSVDCRKNGIILSVDSYVPSAYTEFYNRAEQGRVADYVIMMGYDEHYAGSEAGSVASIGYERRGIEKLLTKVPASKIISGVPLYTRLWKENADGMSSSAMGLASAANWVQENGVELYWQEETGQYYGEKNDGSTNYYIWLEDERSLKLKMELIREFELAGVACWKLGFDTPAVWNVIQP